MDYLELLKSYTWWNNTVHQYLLALMVFVGTVVVLKIFQMIIIGRLANLAKKTATDFDDTLIDIFKSIKPPFYFFIALYFGIKLLVLPALVMEIINVLVWLIVIYEIIKAGEKIVGYIVGRYFNQTKKTNNDQQAQSVAKTLQILLRVTLWITGLILMLANLGVNVTSLIASLGIGGLAVALALQNILSDLFSSFSIYIDKPFEVGDFIIVGSDMGTVQKIGLKSTRIKTLQGEELVIANKELTAVRVQNFKRMERRRVVVRLGVVYGTPKKHLEAIPVYIKEIIEQVNKVDLDRCHFDDYGDFSLNFELVYYIDSPDYNVYMDLKQQINLAIYEKFSNEKIEFAYPTQTIFVQK